jgi:hypothetical protein
MPENQRALAQAVPFAWGFEHGAEGKSTVKEN